MTRDEYRQMKKQKERERRRKEREAWEAARGPMDLPFLLLAMLLLTIGIIMLLSASFPSAQASKDCRYDALYFFKRCGRKPSLKERIFSRFLEIDCEK